MRTAIISLVSNLLLAIAKGVAGVLGNSFALIADAIESTTDVFSSSLVLLGLKYSTKPPDENHPYGHGKIEPVVTFIVVGFLIVSATIIVTQAIHNIREPHDIPKPFTLIVLGAIILVKEISYRYVHRKGQEVQSTSLQADAWHHRSDAITSLIAFLGITWALWMGPGYECADDWAAIVAAGFIVFNAYLILRPALGEIMDEQFYDDMIQQIHDIAANVEGAIEIEKCFIRKSGMTYHADIHLVVDGDISVRTGHDIAHQLKDHIRAAMPEMADVLVHVEPWEGE
ncbi:cation diffusion facilitator family transporter [Lewinella sp. LCG006]|uniref:cation diffusion facilitator family transporter n=1 Tax=Lewinella sp. LCG006 TaxID=3231911 RepID=UPI0034603E6F